MLITTSSALSLLCIIPPKGTSDKKQIGSVYWNAFCAMIGYFRWNVGYFIMNILVMKYWKWTSNIPDDERQRQHQAGNVGRGLAHSAAWGGALRLMICSLGILKCSKNIFHPQVFDIVGKLGEGSYGSVFKALHKESKQILAIKQVNFLLNDHANN